MLDPAVNLRTVPGGVCIDVVVSAGSSRSGVSGIHGRALKIAVRAAPEKGKANAEVETVLAEFFGIGKRSAAVVSGQTSRNKQVQVLNITADAARNALASLVKRRGTA